MSSLTFATPFTVHPKFLSCLTYVLQSDMQSKVSPGKTKGEHLPRATLPEKKKANKGG